MKTKFNGILTLLLAFMVQFTFAQERVISGVVSDDMGPVADITVTVKGTTKGTVTDFDGKYSIKAKKGDTLVFSHISYGTVEKVVGDSDTINVQMKENGETLDAVVINAYGIETTNVSKTASVSTVKSEAIVESGETSVGQALSGKASGVSVVNSSGDPGASAYIQIRGQNSITRDLQPLFVVDGVPMSNDEIGNGVSGVAQQSRINDLNPNDIKSVKILKGASAASIWGSRAANGVVLITTKTGRHSEIGKINVGLSTKVSFDKPMTRIELQDTFGKGSDGSWSGGTGGGSWGDEIALRAGGDDVVDNGGVKFVARDGDVYYPILIKNSKDVYNDKNYDAVFKNGFYQDFNSSLSTRTESGNFYLSLGLLSQDGVIGGGENYYDRVSGRFNSNLKINDKLKLKGSVAYSNVKSNRIQQGSNLSGLLLGLYRTPADFDNTDYIGTRYAADGTPNFNSHRSYRVQTGTPDRSSPRYNNPLWTVNRQKNPNEVARFLIGSELIYDFTNDLTLLTRFGYDHYTDNRKSYFPINSAANSGRGQYSESFIAYGSYNFDAILSYDKNISNDLKSNYSIGFNMNQKGYESRGGSYINFILDTDTFTYANATDENIFSSSSTSLTRTDAFFGYADFDYKNLLTLHVTGRAEQSSTFGNGDVFFYPSAELGFNITGIESLSDSNIVNSAKIKLAWGQVGQLPLAYATDLYFNSASGSDSYGPAYDASSYNGSFQRSVFLPDSSLSPEINTEFELGLNLRMFNNRLKFGIVHYSNVTNDALLSIDVPASTGFSRQYTNAGSIENKGFEIDLGADIIKNNNFNWNLSINWGTNDNKVTDLKGAESVFLGGFAGTSSRAVEGQPLGVLWGGAYARDASNNLILDANGFPTVSPTEQVLGDPNPDWRGGLSNVFTYKGFKLSALFDVSMGGDTWNGTKGALTFFGRTPETANKVTLSAADAATVVNYSGTPVTSIPSAVVNLDGSYTVRGNLSDFGAGTVLLDEAYYTSIGGGFGPVSENFIDDASWAKLRELSISYTLKGKVFDNSFINSLTFGVTGRNLWLWTKDNLDYDPESNLTGASNARGLQYFNHPTTKSFLGSFTINF